MNKKLWNDGVINSFQVEKRAELKLAETQKAVVVLNVFKGQMTEAAKQKLSSHNIELVPVPTNMTHFFQPLDLTVNGSANSIWKHFIVYCSSTVKQHAAWQWKPLLKMLMLIPVWLFMLSSWWTCSIFKIENGAEIITKGWKKAGIVEILDGTVVLLSEDPFEPFFWTLYHFGIVYSFIITFIPITRLKF